MKRMMTGLAAMLLCLLLALPMGTPAEAAEETTAVVETAEETADGAPADDAAAGESVEEVPAEMASAEVMLSDPVISVNGTTVMDMTGLQVYLSGAFDAAFESGNAQLLINGGDERALAAALELAGDYLVFGMNGLSERYYTTVETEGGFYVYGPGLTETDAQYEAGDRLTAAVQALAEGELPGEVSALIEKYGEKLSGKMERVGTETYYMLSGEMEMERSTAVISAEEADAALKELLALAGGHPEFAAVKEVLDSVMGGDVLEGRSLLEVYQELGVEMEMTVDHFAAGENEALEIAQRVTVEGEEEPGLIVWRLIREPHEDGGADFYADVDIYEYDGGEPVAGAYAAASTRMDEAGAMCGLNAEIGMGEYEAGKFAPTAQMLLTTSPVAVGETETTQYALSVLTEELEFSVAVSGYEQDGELYGVIVLMSDEMTVSADFDGAIGADDAIGGVLTVSMEQMGVTYTLSADVIAAAEAVGAGSALGGIEGAVFLDEMDDAQFDEMAIEITATLLNGVSTLEKNVPGLEGLMKSVIEWIYYAEDY